MNEDKPLISVIIPAWNEEKFIAGCLDAVLHQQTDIDYEVIVVNNNSTDGTLDIIKDIEGVKLLQESRQGVAFARNTGAKAARGKIVCFVDADCRPTKGYINYIHKFFSLNSEWEALAGPYVYYDANPIVKFATYSLNYFSIYFSIIKALHKFQHFSGGHFIIMRNAFEKLGGFDEKITNIVYPEDLELSKRMHNLGYKVYFDKNFIMPTSFRRVQRSPFRDAYNRFLFSREVLRVK